MSLASPYQEHYYVADGVTTSFSFGEYFTGLSQAYVKCIIYFDDGTNCVPTFTVDMTTGFITIVTLTKPDGTVLTVPPAGSIVRVFRDTPEQQNVTASQLQNYTAKQLERIFDSVVAMIQEVSYSDLHKTIRLTETQRDVSMEQLKEENDQAILYWDFETRQLKATDYGQNQVVKSDTVDRLVYLQPEGKIYFIPKGSNNPIAIGSATIHNDLSGRNAPDCHPESAITGLREHLQELRDKDIEIEEDVQIALNRSQEAKDTADEAKGIAEYAQTIAEDAKDIAEDAKETAEGIEDIAEEAKDIAQDAKDVADEALDKVTQEITDREDADEDLQDQIDSLSGRGRFLALWNCATGLAESNPPESPYLYKAGDYFVVGTVSSANPAVNYKPDGSSYTTGVASTTVETNEVSVNDTYFYDGTVWKLQSNAQKEVSFSALAGSPYDNTNLSNALNAKQDNISDLATIRSGAALGATAVQPGDLATVATTGDYDDLLNKPTIPTVNDATLTIQKNGTNVATFTANASSAVTANISVPTDTNDLTNGAGYITGITSGDVTTALGYTPANNTDVVHKTGTETITGAKTFENTDSVSASLTALTLKGDNLHKGTNPSSNHFNSIEFTDDSDVNIAKFSAIQTSDGWTGFLAGAGSDPIAPQNNLLMIANGTSKLLLIPATSSHASCAVRRDFFNNNAVKHTPSTAVGSSTQPIYVASDGTATACSLATVASTGAYSDLSGTPTIPTVNNPTITITQGGVTKGSFTLNQASGDTIALDAGGGGSVDIDNLTITKNGDDEIQAVATVNANTAVGATNPVYDWVGTLAEYTTQDVATNHPDWVCYITDDQEATAYQAYTQSQCNNLFVQKAHEVIDFQEPTSANNYTWYRKYADGWVEQGQKKIQIAHNSKGLITLPVVMANTDYIAQAGSNQVNSSGTFGANSTVSANAGTTTQVRLGQFNSASVNMDVWWEVKGMAA